MRLKTETLIPAKVNRRDFLKTTWVALGGLALIESGAVIFGYLQPQSTDGEFGGVITAGTVDDFPPGSVTHITAGRFYLSRLADGGFLAIHQRCTHLGCSVPWEQTEGKFVCPCHSSQFNAAGEVLSPPAPRALDLFAVTIDAGLVQVDTGTVIARERFATEQVVYP